MEGIRNDSSTSSVANDMAPERYLATFTFEFFHLNLSFCLKFVTSRQLLIVKTYKYCAHEQLLYF